jgi:L-amino acid N-acyltransferase YncA
VVNPNVTIRPAHEDDDAAGMIAVLNPIIDAGNLTIMQSPLTVADQVGYIRGFPARGIFHVAVCNDSRRIVGMQSIEQASPSPAMSHVGEISTFVKIDSRGRGIGSSLTRATIDLARHHGFLKIIASVRADNPSAIEFYQRQQFTIIGRACNHARVRNLFIDEVLMERWIGPTDSTLARGS